MAEHEKARDRRPEAGRTETSPFGVVAGRYELLETIGSGGMGVVYRGRDRVLARTVAVKMIRQELAGEEFVRRFEREAAILARLRSPYIVVVYDYGQFEDKFFLVTDYLADGDLHAWLQANGPMPAAQAVPLVAQLAEGLADAHEHDVIHRDIKPGNTLLWRRGGELRPVLADFGIAIASDLSLTATGGVAGSPQYMAPERHLGKPATVGTDIYAMGCLLYAVLVGHAPFNGTQFQVANAHLNDPAPSLPSSVPHAAEIDRVIRDCMAKEPAERIGSAAELAERLRDVGQLFAPPREVPASQPPATPPGGSGSQAPETVLSTPAEPQGIRAEGHRRGAGRALVTVLAVATVIAAAAGGWWAIGGDDDPGSASSPPSETSSSTVVAPPTPGKVDARVSRGYRSIEVVAEMPAASDAVEYRLERKEGSWVRTAPTFAVETEAGGERACTQVRLVATSEGGRAEGPARQLCERALPPVASLEPVAGECVLSTGLPCTWFNVRVAGFRPDEPVTVRLELEPAATFTNQFVDQPVDVDGKGYGICCNPTTVEGELRRGALKLSDAATAAVLTYEGRTWRYELDPLRQRLD